MRPSSPGPWPRWTSRSTATRPSEARRPWIGPRSAALGARQRQRGDAQPERRLRGQAAFYPPVLVVDPVVLGLVEPHQSERLVLVHPGEQVVDLEELARVGPYRGLRQQHRPGGELPHLVNSGAEDAGERIRGMKVVAVDAD